MSKTAQLAKSLGLAKTISVKNLKRPPTCAFSHLIVIDFESTCWNEQSQVKNKNEIIEFPAVFIDMSNGTILREFHHFVTPAENPILSEFCTELTGITQEQANNGIPLPTCICLFKKWYDQLKHDFIIGSMALVTWSDWDLNICLNNECSRKGIFKPAIFNRWIDLRALYKEHTKKYPSSLRAAVESVGLTFIGREHSGIDDARNTARLAYNLHCDGMVLRITKEITR